MGKYYQELFRNIKRNGISRLGYGISLALCFVGIFSIAYWPNSNPTPTLGVVATITILGILLGGYLRVKNIGLRGLLSFGVVLSLTLFPFSTGLMLALLALPTSFAQDPKWDRTATVITLSPIVLLLVIAFFNPPKPQKQSNNQLATHLDSLVQN